MRIVETNNPKILKNYIKYIVGKYHELADKYMFNLESYMKLSVDIACSELEKAELEKDKQAYIQEIRNLYTKMSEFLGDKKLSEVLDENVLDLDILNKSQMGLFNESGEELIIDFNEVNLNNDQVLYNEKVDKNNMTDTRDIKNKI